MAKPRTARVPITPRQADLLMRFEREADAAQQRASAALDTLGAAAQAVLAGQDVRGTVIGVDTDEDPPVLVVEVPAAEGGEADA